MIVVWVSVIEIFSTDLFQIKVVTHIVSEGNESLCLIFRGPGFEIQGLNLSLWWSFSCLFTFYTVMYLIFFLWTNSILLILFFRLALERTGVDLCTCNTLRLRNGETHRCLLSFSLRSWPKSKCLFKITHPYFITRSRHVSFITRSWHVSFPFFYFSGRTFLTTDK